MNRIIKMMVLVFIAGCAAKQPTVQSTVITGVTLGRSTQLYINSDSYKPDENFYPLPFSSNGIVTGYIVRLGYGIYAPALKYNDYEGKTNLSKKIFVIESSCPGKDTGRFAAYDLKQRTEMAKNRGAVAVIFINSDSTVADPAMDYHQPFTPGTIPVIFARGAAAKNLKERVVTNCTVGLEILPAENKSR